MEEEFDGYECISQEQFLMRRLLAFMRSGQSLCTDTMCIDDDVTPPSSSDNGENNFVMMSMLMLLAVIMCFIRPESVMKFTNSKRSVSGSGDGQNQPPPPPAPPAVN